MAIVNSGTLNNENWLRSVMGRGVLGTPPHFSPSLVVHFADMKNSLIAYNLSGNRAKRRTLELIHDAGLTTPLHPDVRKNSQRADFTSCRAVLEIVAAGGFPLLRRVLNVVKAWRIEGEVPADAKKIDLLRGLFQFLKEHGDSFTDKALCDVIKRYPPAELRSKANTQKGKGRIDAGQFKAALKSIFRIAIPITQGLQKAS